MSNSELVESLEPTRLEAVDAALLNTVIADDRSKARNTQFHHLLDVVTKDAKQYAEQEHMDVDSFRYGKSNDDGPLMRAINVVSELRMALIPSENWIGNLATLNFWTHDEEALRRVQDKKTPYIHRQSLEEAVGSYLNLPFRNSVLDRLLVDVLIAAEMYGFADAMLNEQTFGIFPARSPFKQRHVFWNYLLGIAVCGFVLFGLTALSIFAGTRKWINEGWAWGLAGLFSVIFLALLAWETFALPFAWRAQSKNKTNMVNLMTAMFGLYPEVNSSGPISALHIREKANEIARLGVIWPAPLFALLDDIIRRKGVL